VAAAGALVPDLAAGGNFDSFAQSLVGFLFWHLANSFKIIYLKQSKGFPFATPGQNGAQKYKTISL